jgi:hypothetical protein
MADDPKPTDREREIMKLMTTDPAAYARAQPELEALIGARTPRP